MIAVRDLTDDARDVLREARSAGFIVRRDEEDDVDRILIPRGLESHTRPQLVGLVVIRDGVVRYAELLGRIFPVWGFGDGNDDATHHEVALALVEWIRENAR